MKTLFSIIALFALAVGLVIAARYNDGYVLVVLPPYRVEISLNLLLVLLAIGFVVLYSVARLVTTAVQTPARVRQYRLARRRESAHTLLASALEAYFEGRYAKAERAAAQAAALDQSKRLALVVAARAAHELRGYDRSEAYLREAAIDAPGEDALRVVTEAELLLEQRRTREALDALQALPRKHTAALRLELRARQQARQWDEVAALAAELERRNVFDAEQSAKLRAHALAEGLRRKANDAGALDEAWKKVPDALRRDPAVAAVIARAYIALGRGADAQAIVEQSLESAWDSALAGIYGDALGRDPVRQLERAEAWLQAQPRDAALLLSLGKLCARQSLWGKAQTYLEASVAVEPTLAGCVELARLQEKLGNAEAARRLYRESLELALEALGPQGAPGRAGP